MKAVEMKKGIYWVGGIDWDLRNFHGYLTQKGSTYNAYLVIDEKITLIDTVKYYLFDEMLSRISSVIDPSKIDYIIADHVEMDHSGSLPMMKKVAPQAKIITSMNGEKGLKAHFDTQGWDFQVMKLGDHLQTGKYHFSFVPVPMVHWPDNMMCFLEEEGILFSNDAFGQHLASSERFDDQRPIDEVMEQAAKYYANIVLPFDGQVRKALDEAGKLSGVQMIAPSHGLIWRSHISEILENYQKWAANESVKKAVIVFDTMWNSTKKIALALAEELERKGIAFTFMDLKTNHISDVMTEVLTSQYVLVGSPTLNNQILPTVAAFLTYFKGLKPKKRKGLAFGSFGWSGESVAQVEEYLTSTGLEVLPSIKIQYIPEAGALKELAAKALESL